MFELRRLRLGERPVTGQPNRERIETFLNNLQENQQETRVPSTRPVVPSAHIADINSLANRRCVSAALSSTAFRQDLENTIRHSIRTPSVASVQQVPTPVTVERPRITQTVPSVPIEQQRSRIPQTIPSTPVEQQRPRITQTVPPVHIEQQPLNVQRYFIPNNLSIH
jgi:hypothetical protein